jgi:FkbM family methyltransferase
MKVEKLTSDNQPQNWFNIVTDECRNYPIHLVDIRDDELVVDIGANVGGFYEAWKHKFQKWVAVEASKWNCELYKQNTGRDVEIHKAVWGKSGETLKLQGYKGDEQSDTPSGNFGVTEFVNDSNKHGWQGDYEEVETISYEDLFGEDEVGLLKVDCEGAEYEFLYGKDVTKIKYIVMELHNFLGKEKHEKFMKWIEKTHTEIYTEGNGVDSHYVKLWKRK